MNQKLLLTALSFCLLLLIACNAQPDPILLPTAVPIEATPAVAITPTLAADVATAVPPTTSPTEIPPSPTASPTSVPTPIDDQPTRIQFESGATSMVINGRITQPGSDDFVLYALAGQLMTINIDSPNNDVRLMLYGLDDGQPLSRADSGATYWRDTLQQTQDYALSAVYNGSGADYTLTVQIDPQPANNGPVDQTIQFAPNANTATVTGIIGTAFTPDTYRFAVNAGQTIFVSVESLTSSVEPNVTVNSPQFGYVSPDGVFRNMQQWAGQLPGSEMVSVQVNANQDNVDYVLDVQVRDTLPNVIQFAPGATAATLNGRIAANEVIVYALEASAGQEMTARLSSDIGAGQMFVELADRAAYLGFNSSNNQTEWSGTLPQTGPYYLFVTSKYPRNYSLDVTIVTPPAPAAAASCPVPAAQQKRFADPTLDFCFLYPAGLRAFASDHGIGSGISGTAVWGPPLNNGPEPLAVGMNLTYLEAANGRSASQVADDYINQTGGQLGETISIGGETAVIVNDVPGLFPTKSIFLVHNDIVYQFLFAPDGMNTPITLPTLTDLYDAVLSSFTFLN